MNTLHALLRKAAQAALAGATVVTPTERAARSVRSACETKMAGSGKPWHTPRVLNWGAFVGWLWREAMMTSAVSTVLLSREQQQVVWQQVVTASPEGARLMNVAGASARAQDAWNLIHSYRLPFPSPAFDRAPETKAFAQWATDFSREMARNGWTDNARAADQLTSAANQLGSVISGVVAYGFDEITPQQNALLQSLRGTGVQVEQLTHVAQMRLDGSLEQDHVRLHAANDEEDEVRCAATWARNQLNANSSAQIGVIVPRLNEIRATVEHVLTQVLHPDSFFSPSPNDAAIFELSAAGSLAEQGVVDTALRALRFASAGLPQEEVCRLIRSAYFAGAAEERSARVAMDLALRKCPTPSVEPPQLLELARSGRANRFTRHLSAFTERCAPFAEQHAPGAWAGHMSAALTALGWPGELSAREAQIHEAFLDLLRRFSALEVVRPAKLSGAQAVREVAGMARDRQFRPKTGNAPVQVLTIADAAGSVFDALWLCGMSDEAWPPRSAANAFIPIALQMSHALPHSSPESENELAAKRLARSYASAHAVIVSFPKRDKDRELRPAPQVAELIVALPEICEPVAPSVASFVPYSATESFADEQAPPAMPGRHAGGTKMFELQSTCPFRAFAQTRLLARQLREAYTGPNYIERGQRIESVLQRVWDELKDWQTLQRRSSELEFQQIIERAVEGAIQEFIPQPGRWFDNYRAVERSRLTQLTMNWLAMELRRSPFVKVEHQQETEITVGGVTVNARIDRIDHLPDGSIAVIDYKSGDGFSSRHWEAPRMDAPQLPLYAVAQAQGSVSAVAFGIARTSKCDLSGYARQSQLIGKDSRGVERDMTHLIEGWREELEGVAAAFLAGEAEVDPKHKRKTCAWCHLGAMCRVKERSAAEITEEVDDDE